MKMKHNCSVYVTNRNKSKLRSGNNLFNVAKIVNSVTIISNSQSTIKGNAITLKLLLHKKKDLAKL